MPTVVLEVTYTEPGLKGDTASSTALKAAEVETGAKVMVPLFISLSLIHICRLVFTTRCKGRRGCWCLGFSGTDNVGTRGVISGDGWLSGMIGLLSPGEAVSVK